MRATRLRLRHGERGAALIEVAITLPLLLLVATGIFEFGRAYQTWQVLTNAAREGARLAVLPGMDDDVVKARVKDYLTAGMLDGAADATVAVSHDTPIPLGATSASGSKVTVQYPFEFIVLQPIAELVAKETTVGTPFTMAASAVMRNE